ncbi:MAG: SBBP repeat-containing protein [Fimbriimonas sp.]
MAQTPGLNYWVTDDGLVLDYYVRTLDRSKSKTKSDRKSKIQSSKIEIDRVKGNVVTMSFLGAQPASVSPDKAIRTRTDYYRPGLQVRGARSYGEVRQRGLYKGIDVRNYFDRGMPRYDVVVAAKADPSVVKMSFKGVKALKAKGDVLEMSTSVGTVRQSHLVAYQMVDGRRRTIPASFVAAKDGTVSFALGAYDRSRELVIDPLVYGSYFGGNFGFDRVSAVVSEPDGGVFMTGWTQSASFPAISGPYGVNLRGSRDAFVTRFQGDAYNIDYNAYIGGTGSDQGDFIAMDPSKENVWIAGRTTSANLPGINANSFRQNQGPFFMMRFTKSQSEVLTPTYSTYYGPATGQMALNGFTVAPNGELVLAGLVLGTIQTTGSDPAFTTPRGGIDIFLARFDGSGRTLNQARYFGGSLDDHVGALAVDPQSNAVIAGTIEFNPNGGSADTALQPGLFETTPGVFPNGRLLRTSDAYVARFAPTGTTLYSAIIGGSDYDIGTGVAVDDEGNAYILGESGSFDFPRTRGVIGEQNLLGTVTVTKVRPSTGVAAGQQIVYSTGLNTSGNAFSVGIAVDSRGNATVTGTVGAVAQWTNPPANSPNPNVPIGHLNPGNIQTTTDNIKPAYTRAANNDVSWYPTNDCWINTINSTATSLLYGSYIGTSLDDDVSPPYVDPVGDVWVFGMTVVQTEYWVDPWKDQATTQSIPKRAYDPLPGSHITPLAFKPTPDVPIGIANAAQSDQDLGQREYQVFPGGFPEAVFPTARADGYILRFRNTIPTVASVTITPNVAAGGPNGSGVRVTGTITLGADAPASGADVTVTLSNTGAALIVDGETEGSKVVHIDAGARTGTFTVETKEVTTQTAVNITASYEGNFKVAQLNVVPWLQAIAVTPNTLVGGNLTTGRVTLAQNAPTGGLVVELTTDTPSLISFANAAGTPITSVTVPAGQATTTFTIVTQGVSTQTNVNVTASALGVNRSQQLTLNTANLRSLTFNPTNLAGLGTTTGTLTLDGKSGSAFTVTLTGLPGTYSIPPTINFPANQSSVTFQVTTPIEPVRTTRTVTATRPASGGYAAGSASGSFTVEVATVKSITLTPSTVPSGGVSTVIVELNSPAPAGGATVQIITDPNKVSAPPSIIIPAGAASRSFTVTATVVPATTTATITARRTDADAKSATLTIQAGTFGLTVSPTSVLGGRENSTGTITLSSPAGPLGLTINLSSSDPGVTVPATVTIPSGATTVTFAITTSAVTSNRNVTIIASTAGFSTTAELTVRANGVALLTINPTKVRGGSSISVTITLDAPAGPGGQVVNLSSSNGSVIVLPPTRTVPAGQRTLTFSVVTRRVSRTLAATITASAAGSSATASVTVVR